MHVSCVCFLCGVGVHLQDMFEECAVRLVGVYLWCVSDENVVCVSLTGMRAYVWYTWDVDVHTCICGMYGVSVVCIRCVCVCVCVCVWNSVGVLVVYVWSVCVHCVRVASVAYVCGSI